MLIKELSPHLTNNAVITALRNKSIRTGTNLEQDKDLVLIVKEGIESYARRKVKDVPKVLRDLMVEAGYTVGYDATEHDLGLEGYVECPYRNDVEAYTIKQLVKEEGGFKGKNLVDFGSGGGVYARYAVDNGASSVLGVDLDVGFIIKAIKDNDGYEDTISYWIGDIQDYRGSEDKDMAIGSYIFSYPKTKEEAINYAKAVASSLKPGGVFIGFNDSPFDVYQGKKYQEFGFTRELESADEGSKVIYKFDEISDPIINYHLKPETYKEAFREVGLSLEWREVQLDPQSKKVPAYWDNFFTNHGENPTSPFVAMVARKIKGQ